MLYLVVNTITDESYVGLTVCRGQAKQRSAKERWNQHVYNAFVRNLQTPLYTNIRQYGADNFKVTILDVVRGKSTAHLKETELVRENKPELNILKVGK